MPLPTTDQAWPPKWMEDSQKLVTIHDAWYAGDPNELSHLYAHNASLFVNRPAQYAGGVTGAFARFWWGKPAAGNNRALPRLHLGVPAALSQASADLLMSEPPRVVIPDASRTRPDGTIETSPEQEAIEALVNTPETHTAWLQAAELASAHGGVYLRLVWNRDHLERVALNVVHADQAVPEFRFGTLSAVTFWSQVKTREGGGTRESTVWRWLERYEHDRIEHGLYEGTAARLGRRVSLAEAAQTAWLEPEQQGIDLTEDGLGRVIAFPNPTRRVPAVYVPNIFPNRFFRRDALLRDFGRSDYQGIEHGFDAIDEAWTSWQRDIRLAKARLIVPRAFLEGNERGGGARFDVDQEVYEGLDFLGDVQGQSITPQQFDIRVEQHERTIAEWTRYVLRSAGQNPSTIGDGGVRQAQATATEVKADNDLSERTRDKKTNYWKRAIGHLVPVWVALDNWVYGRSAPIPESVEVRFPAEAQQDQLELAQIAQALTVAKAASTMTLVRMLHPEWDGETVNAEVDRIKEEHSMGLAFAPDGATFNGGGFGQPGQGNPDDEESPGDEE